MFDAIFATGGFIADIFVPIVAFLIFYVVFRIVCRFWQEGKNVYTARGNPIAMKMARIRGVAWLLTLLSVVCFFFGMKVGIDLVKDRDDVGLIFVCGIVAALPCAIWGTIKLGEYNRMFKEHFVEAELEKVFTNLEFAPRERFSDEEIVGLGFFSKIDHMTGNDLISAEYKNVRFKQCDLVVSELRANPSSGSDDSGDSGHSYEDLFKGRVMRFDFADTFKDTVQVVAKDFSGTQSKFDSTWQKVETELAEFNDNFTVFTKDPLAAMAVLTPQMIEGIFHLHKAVKSPIAFYYKGSSMYVFLAIGRDSFDVALNVTLEEEKKLLQKDIQFVIEVLETMYFKRQE